VRKYTHNEEGQLISEDLELFLGAINNQDSIGNYFIDRNYNNKLKKYFEKRNPAYSTNVR
jgi:hypothetical protein